MRLALLLLCICPALTAAQGFPARQISIMVPYPPGSTLGPHPARHRAAHVAVARRCGDRRKPARGRRQRRRGRRRQGRRERTPAAHGALRDPRHQSVALQGPRLRPAEGPHPGDQRRDDARTCGWPILRSRPGPSPTCSRPRAPSPAPSRSPPAATAPPATFAASFSRRRRRWTCCTSLTRARRPRCRTSLPDACPSCATTSPTSSRTYARAS